MRTRSLLVIGVTAIAASLLLGVAGLATGQMAQWSIAAPGGMIGRTFGGGDGDIGMDRAVTIAQDVATSYSGGGLAADDVIEFANNYYASIREKGTGIGAFEILIDRASGQVTREPGPDMMWNAKYGNDVHVRRHDGRLRLHAVNERDRATGPGHRTTMARR